MKKKRWFSLAMVIMLMIAVIDPSAFSYAMESGKDQTLAIRPEQSEGQGESALSEESEADEDQGGTDGAALAAEDETEICISNGDEAFVPGMQGTWKAVMTPTDDGYTYQWQISTDGEHWTDMEGETNFWYTFDVTESVFAQWYRVAAVPSEGISAKEQAVERKTVYSEPVRPHEAVCYVEEKSLTRAAGDVEGYGSLADAFGAYDDGLFSHNITIVLLRDVVIQSGITVGCPKSMETYKNTYTLKSKDGNHFTVYPEKYFQSTNSAMFYLDGDGSGAIDGRSEVILQNVSIQGYPQGEEPIGSNQVDTIFSMKKSNTWLTIQGNTSLKNPGAGLIQIEEGETDSVTIESGEGNANSGPLTMLGEIRLPPVGKKMVISGDSANFTHDSDVALVSDSWSDGRWFGNYTKQPLPTEMAYFRMKNPGNHWVVFDDSYAGDGKSGWGITAANGRPEIIYAGPVLADGSLQSDPYAQGILPGKDGEDTGRSAVPTLAAAFAKIRQLNNDEGDKAAKLAIVSEFVLDEDYMISGTEFSGEGYVWEWKNPTEIQRYYRPAGRTSADAGYGTESYSGNLFRINGAAVTLRNLTVSGKGDTNSLKRAQAPLFTVETGGTLVLDQAILKNNQNYGEQAKGGAVFLQGGSTLQSVNHSTLLGNETGASGKGAGVYVSAGAILKLSGIYETESSQTIWLEDGDTDGRFVVDSTFSVEGAERIPVNLDVYEDGRVIAEYCHGNADMNEAEKFGPDEEKLLAGSLYLAAEGGELVLRRQEGGMEFGFTKTDREKNPVADVAFRLYRCSEGHGSEQHSQLADLYEADEDNCWQQISRKASTADGKVLFGYLRDGEYRLAEVKGPYGYEIPRGQWKLIVDSTEQELQRRLRLEYIAAEGEKAPETTVTVSPEGKGVDTDRTIIQNRDAKLTDFVFRVQASDSEAPMTGVQFQFYACENWKDPTHSHGELVTEEVLEQGECWHTYARGSENQDGVFVSDGSGGVCLKGLMDGDYMLRQISTLEGYSLPESQWLIRVRSGEEYPITILKKGNDGASDFRIWADESGNLIYTLVNQRISEPGHRKYVRYQGDGSYNLTLDITGNAQASQKNENPVSVVFVVDTAPAMRSTQKENGYSSTTHTYMYYAQNAMKLLAQKILNQDSRNQIAVVDFAASHWAYGGETPFNDAWVHQSWTGDQDTAIDAINSLEIKTNGYWNGEWYNGLTYNSNWEAGFRTAKELFDGTSGVPNAGNDTVVILLSDGRTESRYRPEDGVSDSNTYWNAYGTRPYQDFALPELKELLGLAGARFQSVSVYEGSERNLVAQQDAPSNEVYTRMYGSSTMVVNDLKEAGYTADFYQGYVVSENASSYMSQGLGAFLAAFDGYETDLFTQSNVRVTDILSDYVQPLNPDSFSYSLAAYYADGTDAQVPEGTSVSYEKMAKKVTLAFPKDFALEDGVTYRLDFSIKPTQQAYEEYYANGYKSVGDLGTDAQGNHTSSGQPGFYSNTSGKVEYDFAYSKALTATYPRPVIQIPTAQVHILKCDKDTKEPLEGVEFILYRRAEESADTNPPGDGWAQGQVYRTDAQGILDLGNLAEGTYRLMESGPLENYKQPKAQWEICVAAQTQQDAVQIRELSLSGAQQQPANYLAFDPKTDQWMIQNQRLAEQPVRFLKTDAGNKEHFLNGVSFKLYSCPNTETGHQHELLASQESQRNGCWEPVQEHGRDKLFTSTRLEDFDGMVDLGTLAEGEYMLVEVETLPGYVLPKGQWMLTVGDGLGDYEFTVKGDSNTPEFWRHSSGSAQDVIWAVSNEKEIIPITGAYVNGPKKLILILPGGILAVGMAWRLTYKRRKRSREKRG